MAAPATRAAWTSRMVLGMEHRRWWRVRAVGGDGPWLLLGQCGTAEEGGPAAAADAVVAAAAALDVV